MAGQSRPAKHGCFWLLSICLAGCGWPDSHLSTAQSGSSGRSAHAAAPRLTIVDPHRDLGVIALGRQNAHFTVINHGQEPLRIHRLETSCGCLDVKLSQTTLEPGESGRLEVWIHPKRTESRAAKVSLHCNDPLSPIPVTVEWQARGPVDIVPMTVDFGRIAPGATAMRELTVTRHGVGLTCRTIIRVTPNSQLTVTSRGPHPEDSDAERWEIRLVADDLSGAYHGAVHFSFEGCDHDPIAVPVTWESRHLLNVTPSSLFLGNVPAGRAVQGELTIQSPNESMLKLRDHHWKDQRFELDVQFVPDENQLGGRLIITGNAPGPGNHRDLLMLTFETSDVMRVEVPVVLVVPIEPSDP